MATHLEYGSIIQINSETNPEYNGKTYFIDYIDSDKIRLINDTTFELSQLNIIDNKLTDESIDSITILSVPEEKGYARQNRLLKDTWVNIHFGGEFPTIITGVISDLEKDMIEVTLHDSKEVIYIDFEYKGIPEDIPIEKIQIRAPPEAEKEEKAVMPPDAVDVVESKPDKADDELSIERDDGIFEVPVRELKTKLLEVIAEADDLFIGEDLGSITQEVVVDEKERRFNIDEQTEDLMNELLSSIPNVDRTNKVMNNLSRIITRFKQLRRSFSTIDERGVVLQLNKKSRDYKPLVDKLYKLQENIHWIMPVVTNTKKVYDVDDATLDDALDVISFTMAESRNMEAKIENGYYGGEFVDTENKYEHLIKSLNPMLTPFTEPVDDTEVIHKGHVHANLACVVDNIEVNLEQLYTNVVKNDTLKRQRFVIDRYNLGIDQHKTNYKDVENPTIINPITESDEAYVKGFVMLPKPYVQYSRVSLPDTPIIVKANLNSTSVNYWSVLRKKTSVTQEIVSDVNTNIEYSKDDFLENIKYITMDSTLSADDRYKKFLQTFIPQTSDLFDITKEYIQNKTSFVSIVSYLEPFLIYKGDITYNDYRVIVDFIVENINKMMSKIAKASTDTNVLRTWKLKIMYSGSILITMLDKYTSGKDEILSSYGISVDEMSSEAFRKIMLLDSGKLYMNALAMLMSSLYTDTNIKQQLEDKITALTGLPDDSQQKDCADSLRLSKNYYELDELEADNGVTIHYDKKYDETRYDIMAEYTKKKDTMSRDEFKDFLVRELQSNVGMTEKNALSEAQALIDGHRNVEEGDYAVLQTMDGEGNTIYYLYSRNDDQWVLDDAKTTNDISVMHSYFCNTREKCLSMKRECKSTENVRRTIDKSITEGLIKDLMDEHILHSSELKRSIEDDFSESKEAIRHIKQLIIDETFMYSKQKYGMGLEAEYTDVVRSPYIRLRDLILGESDFLRRQTNLQRFVTTLVRAANIDSEEDPNWLYCIKTNTKLLPSFYETLAFTTQKDYEGVLDKICSERGQISDDNDKWVDKYSGYTIRFIEFDTEEGYDEAGFKVNTRQVVEEDLSSAVAGIKLVAADKITKETIEMRYINNVISSISHSMGINIESSREFIVRNVLLLINEIHGDKKSYDSKRDRLRQKGKKVPPYEYKLNQYILFFTSLFMLVSIQTAIPSIRTKKTYPNCKRSFEGFPMNESLGNGALDYIVCIIKNTTGGSEPWNSFKRLSSDKIKEFMKKYYVKHVSTNADVIQKIAEKEEYLELNPVDDMIPDDINVVNWTAFLPPLQKLDITSVRNINELFQKEMFMFLKSGNSKQHERLDIVRSKMLFKSLEIIQEINNIVAKEGALLETKAGEPFLENACCRSTFEQVTLNYFKNKNSHITRNIEDVIALTKMIGDIMSLTKASILYSNENTKIQYPPITQEYSETTIYQTFIDFCKINKGIPVHPSLQMYCLDNSSGFDDTHTLDEKIRIMKSEGKNFSYDAFLQLLNQVNRHRVFTIELNDQVSSKRQLLEAYLKHMETSSTHIDNTFEKHLLHLLDTFTIDRESNKEAHDALYDYVYATNEELYATLVEFLRTKSNQTNDKIIAFIDNITKFVEQEKTETLGKKDSTLNYSITYLQNVIKQMLEDFPNMIINKVSYKDKKVLKYWNLSVKHQKQVSEFIHKSYQPLEPNYSIKPLKPILEQVLEQKQSLLQIIKHIPFLYESHINGESVESMFNSTLVRELYRFIIIQTFALYINITEEVSTDDLEISDMMSEYTSEALQVGEAAKLQEQVADMLVSYCAILMKQKELINTNKKSIEERLLIVRDTEKDRKTRYLQNLTEEERQVDTAFKHMKLGRWNKGIQKGLTQYVRETYDEELRDAEQEALLDFKLSSNMNVTDMNREIYRFSALEQHMAEQEAEREAYDMSMLANDDEFDEGMDGDEY